MPDSLPWSQATAAMGAVSGPPPRDAGLVVASELERARQIALLRQTFREGCQRAGIAVPPMHVIERWLFLCKWHDSCSGMNEASGGSADPLLPVSAAAAAADATLASDLCRAGVERSHAAKFAEDLRMSAAEAARAVDRAAGITSSSSSSSSSSANRSSGGSSASSRSEGSALRIHLTYLGGGMVRLESDSSTRDTQVEAGNPTGTRSMVASGAGGDERSMGSKGAEIPVRAVDVTEACVEKLRILYMRNGTGCNGDGKKRKAVIALREKEQEEEFLARLFGCLLRYRSVGGLGFQASLGGHVFRALQSLIGCNFEVFASPFNTYYGAYCSAFPDVDACFGSSGPFGTFHPVRGSYQCNPPFVPHVIDAAADHMLRLLRAAQEAGEPLCFAVVLPGWTECAGYAALLNAAPFLRRSLLVAAADHGFVDGGQHTRKRTYRESPYDTMLFVLQSDLAASKWPVSGTKGDEAMRQLEHAFARCTPSMEELESVSTSERVHRGGAARKKRRKMKRAGKQTKAREQAKNKTKR